MLSRLHIALSSWLRGAITFDRLLFGRSWRQVTRDKATNISRAGVNVSSAIIFGSIFWRMRRTQTAIQDRQGLLQVQAPARYCFMRVTTSRTLPRLCMLKVGLDSASRQPRSWVALLPTQKIRLYAGGGGQHGNEQPGQDAECVPARKDDCDA